MNYIRFKNIPDNKKSGIYDGDLGKVGEEAGLSCYECIKDENNYYKIIIPSLEVGCLYDLIGFIEDKCPIYLIQGNKIGIGTYDEPVIENPIIISKLKIIEFANPIPKFKLDKTNKQSI